MPLVMTQRRGRLWIGFLYAGLGAAVCDVHAQQESPPFQGRQLAVLIAVQKHDDSTLNLHFTIQDVKGLKKTLSERAGLGTANFLEMTDESPPGFRPTLANLRTELPSFLERVNPQDRVVVFFSGHGFSVDGRTYLVPADFQREAAQKTGLPTVEVREALAKCKAQVKFLILDCCQAGGEKGMQVEGVSGERVAQALSPSGVPGCVVLASCRVAERSYEWPDHKQSIFTYWLCRALDGGADNDGNGQLTVDEVFNYTNDRVKETASRVFEREQTPVRMIGAGSTGVPVLLNLRPEPPDSLCGRLAAHLDLEIRTRKLKRIGVLEFIEPLARFDRLGQSNLSAYCAEKVRTELVRLSNGTAYQVLDGEEFRQASKGMEIVDVEDPDAVQRLAVQAGGLDAVILGEIRRRGQAMHVVCDLMETTGGNSLVRPSGLMPLTESLLVNAGESVDNRERPEPEPNPASAVPHIREKARQENPLLKDDFPVKVELWSFGVHPDGKVPRGTASRRMEFLRPEVRGGAKGQARTRDDLTIAARHGEIYTIRVRNNSESRIGMALLIDGLNTIEKKRELVEQARLWTLEPMGYYDIPGWWTSGSAGAQADEVVDFTSKSFLFTEPVDSVAGRMKFGESIGTISVAFYREAGNRGRIGTGEGEATKGTIKISDFKRGPLFGSATIRYVEGRQRVIPPGGLKAQARPKDQAVGARLRPSR